MPSKSTTKIQAEELPKTPKKRVRAKTARPAARKILTRRKKTARDEEAPVVKIDSIKTKERSVEIRVVDQVPISPYVIEFRTDEAVEVAPFSSPSPSPLPSREGVHAIFTPDFAALEEFFVGTEHEAGKEAREVRMREHSEGRRRPNGVSAGGCEGSVRGVSDSEAPRHDEQRPGDSERSRTPAPPKILHAPVLRPMLSHAFSTFKMSTSRVVSKLFAIKLLPTRSLLRATAAFAVIALVFTMPATGLQAYTALEQTKDALLLKNQQALAGFNVAFDDPEALKATLGLANTTFINTKNDLEHAVGIFSAVLPFIPKAGSTFRSSTLLLGAGAHLTEAGRTIADGFALMTDTALPLGERLLHLEEALSVAFPLIRAAEKELLHTKSNSLPARARGPVTTLQTLVPVVRAGLTQTLAILPALENFLGTDAPKRYLVIFQNPHELRPTGGFIGSFALLDLDQGEITNLEVPSGGPYDLACCLKEHVIAPEPLHLIEPHWQFHDANWFPDFPTSAQKLMWFYMKSGGPSVDGVIAINATLIPELLSLVGPIDMPAYGRTFTSENFIAETQKIVELEYDRLENRPKAVIGDLAPILIERLMTLPREQFLPLIETFASALATKTIQLYSTGEETQTIFSENGWTGEMKSTAGDYLMVVSANIAGGKSNATIETVIAHRATLDAGGIITDEVRIQKTHTGAKGDLFSGVRNVDYVRVYVPKGSSLVAASGFESPPVSLFTDPNEDYKTDEDLRRLVKPVGVESVSGTAITNEHGKTAFGNWMQTDPGETTVATLTYRLPQPLAPLAARSGLAALLGVPERLPYTLLVQSQSGTTPQFTHQLVAPGLKKTWGASVISQPLTTDLFTAALFER